MNYHLWIIPSSRGARAARGGGHVRVPPSGPRPRALVLPPYHDVCFRAISGHHRPESPGWVAVHANITHSLIGRPIP